MRNIIIEKQQLVYLVRDLLKSIPTLTFTFLPLKTENPLYIGASWYLSAMLTAMLILYPLLLKWFNVCTKYVFPIAAVFMLGYLYGNYGSICTWNTWNGFCYLGIIRALAEISIGASLVPLSEAIGKCCQTELLQKNIAMILLTIIKYGSVTIVIISCIRSVGLNDINLLFYLIIFVLLSFSNIGYQLKDSRMSKMLGKMSLPIYIFHPVMLYSAQAYLNDRKVSTGTYFIFVFGSILVSIVLMFALDKIKKVLIVRCRGNFKQNVI